MFIHNKRQPALTDLDPMPFGKYKGTPMQDVPASYLVWLRNEGCRDPLVANYIHNSWEAIQQEIGDKE
jgi:hypothetical protein